MARPGGDDLPFVYSGTLVVKGQAIAQVVATGVRTEMGKIGKALQVLEPEETNLQKQTGPHRPNLCPGGSGAVRAGRRGLRPHARQLAGTGSWPGITLAMATLPEEFPVVLTIFLALGAWRISQRKVLTRRVPAIEMLGAATALCVDKTGTLTLNRMTVTQLAVGESIHPVAETQSRLPGSAARGGRIQPPGQPDDPFDPMEKADEGARGPRPGRPPSTCTRGLDAVQEYPLSEKLA